jgi:aquaporin NIP
VLRLIGRRAFVAEALGTFALVFVGTGAIVVDALTDGALTRLGVSLAFGLIVLVLVESLGNVSGAHFNPAVSVAFVAAKRLAWRALPSYAAAQLIGAFAASVAIRGLFGNTAGLGATLPHGSMAQSFLLELLLSAILVFVILLVSDRSRARNRLAGVAIASVVAAAAWVGGPISGASMNPARSLAPACVSGDLTGAWIYVSAPLLGALVGLTACRFTRATSCCAARQAGCA